MANGDTNINLLPNPQPNGVINEKLFEVINLDYPGLEKVKEYYEANEYYYAAHELLKYYRNRSDVSNPNINLINPSITAFDQNIADQALEHRFYVRNFKEKEENGKEVYYLFDKDKKKKIRRVPNTIGIVTSPTGAAIKDILTTIKRRFPVCNTILFPALVQGENAANDIANKIKLANEVKDIYGIDTLIVGRGGGSLEDLWPFNEEVVARAIYDSTLPVISAVGHEIDITISDYVADLRAPTPTAAAELAVPDINTIITYLNTVSTRSNTALNNIISNNYQRLENIKNSYILTRPITMYEIKEQKLDILIDNLNKSINKLLEDNKIKLYTYSNSYVLNNPEILYKYSSQKLEHIISKLEVLNPLNTLNRGYAIIKKDNKVLSSIKNINNDDIIKISLKDGEVSSKVIKVGE